MQEMQSRSRRRFVGAFLPIVALTATGIWFSQPTVAEAPSPPSGYDLLPSFSEEFDGSTLRSVWQTSFRAPGGISNRSLYGNRERQIYFDPAFLGLGIQPFSVGQGVLTITAAPLLGVAKQRLNEALANEPEKIRGSALKDVGYSSGLISSKGQFQQLYGYFEMRARWTGGRGVWPAFWLLPPSGEWPPEIDILEAHGDKPTTAFQSVHSKVQTSITRKVSLSGTTADFHRYGVLWTPQTLDYYIDGVKTASIPTPADMNKPLYLLANLAIGGSWPGDPDANTVMPARMQIDYIRAWRFDRPPG